MKKYKFVLDKYFDENECEKIFPIIENFVNYFGDENGKATINIADDVVVYVNRNEGAVAHMTIDNERFDNLPKTLSSAKQIASVFIRKMADEVNKKLALEKAESMKQNVEKQAENDFIGYIGGEVSKSDDAPASDTTENIFVKKNGKVVTDAAEKQEVIDEIEKAKADVTERINKFVSKFFKDYLED